MTIKYYSDKLNKLFDTEEELLKEEAIFDERETKLAELEQSYNETKTAYEQACKNIELAEKEAYEIVREAKERADELVQEAESDKLECYRKYKAAHTAYLAAKRQNATTSTTTDATVATEKMKALDNDWLAIWEKLFGKDLVQKAMNYTTKENEKETE